MAQGTGDLNPGDIEEAVDRVIGEEVAPDASRLRRMLEDICDADMRTMVDEHNAMKPYHAWPDREARAVTQWSYNDKTGVWRVKFADPIKAAEQIARLDGLYDGKDARGPVERQLEAVPRPVLQAIMARLARVDGNAGAGPAQETAAPAPEAARHGHEQGDRAPVLVPVSDTRPGGGPAIDEFDPI